MMAPTEGTWCCLNSRYHRNPIESRQPRGGNHTIDRLAAEFPSAPAVFLQLFPVLAVRWLRSCTMLNTHNLPCLPAPPFTFHTNGMAPAPTPTETEMPVGMPVTLPGDTPPSEMSFSFSFSFDMEDDGESPPAALGETASTPAPKEPTPVYPGSLAAASSVSLPGQCSRSDHFLALRSLAQSFRVLPCRRRCTGSYADRDAGGDACDGSHRRFVVFAWTLATVTVSSPDSREGGGIAP